MIRIEFVPHQRETMLVGNFCCVCDTPSNFCYLCERQNIKRKTQMAKETKIKDGTIEDLVFDDLNFNQHTEFGMSQLEKSLRKFGAGRSILVDKDNRIIGGNGITEAAVNAGITKTKVVEVTGDELVVVKRTDVALDSEQGRGMALADNATSAVNLQWNTENLEKAKERWGVVPEDWGVELPESAGGSGGGASEDEFDESEVTEAVCKRGEVWRLGEHRLMCGDSTSEEDFAKLMGEERADMVFTDPPYGVSIGDKNKTLNAVQPVERIERNIVNDTLAPSELYPILVKAMTNVRENCKDDASYYVTSPQGGELGMMMMMMKKDAGLQVRHILVWCKNTATFSLGRLDYDYQHEPIFYTWTKSHHNYRGGEYRTTIWKYDKPRKCDLHPTMKPVELVANCLKDCTKEGMLVLDAFGGSGTTIIAAEQLNRKCRMMELDPHYCDVIIARWEKLTGQKAERIDYGI